jgi:hypothetical protein
MSERSERARRRMSLITTVAIAIGVIGLGVLAVVLHT